MKVLLEAFGRYEDAGMRSTWWQQLQLCETEDDKNDFFPSSDVVGLPLHVQSSIQEEWMETGIRGEFPEVLAWSMECMLVDVGGCRGCVVESVQHALDLVAKVEALLHPHQVDVDLPDRVRRVGIHHVPADLTPLIARIIQDGNDNVHNAWAMLTASQKADVQRFLRWHKPDGCTDVANLVSLEKIREICRKI